MEKMSIQEMSAILRRGLALMIIFPLVATSVVAVYYFFYAENQYTAETMLYVLIDYGDTMGSMRFDVTTSTSFAGDYQQLIKTHEVLSAAAKKLGVKNLDGLRINVSSQENTRVICLSVTGRDPSLCMKAANTISEVFIEYLATITRTKSVSIASEALMPSIPSGPDRVRNTAYALILSILFIAGMLIAIAMMNTTIRTSEDVENYLHVPVLARIVGYKKEMDRFTAQKGIRKPFYYSVSPDTREGIKTLSMNLQFVSGSDAVKTLAVTSASPKEGKSTIAVMLATALVEEGKRVLLCDMDFRNPSLGRYLGIRNRLDVVDVLQGTAKIDQVIVESSVKGLFLVDSYHKHVNISSMIQSPRYQEFINDAGHRFDYVIIDTPPVGFFVDSAMLANIADKTLLVVASGLVQRALEKEVVDQLHKADASIIGVALNFIDNRNNHYGQHYRYYGKYRDDCAYYDSNSFFPNRLRS